MKASPVVVAFLLGAGLSGSARAADPEKARQAKTLFFDRQYAQARDAWQAVLLHSRGPEADQAAFWIARASESLGEAERAFKEYGAFLARRPADQALVDEARTNRVGLAAQLYKSGQRQHLDVIYAGLEDPARTVRYYAAFQLANLGPAAGKRAIPILRRIIEQEKDEDLVDRAKLYLMKLDPESLSRIEPRLSAEGRLSAPRADGRMLRVRIFGNGLSRPKVTVNLPMTLADLLFKSLPDEAKRELRRKGYDADNFWDQLKKLGPTQIVDIEGNEGERIQIWIE